MRIIIIMLHFFILFQFYLIYLKIVLLILKNVEYFKYSKKKIKLKLLRKEGRCLSQRKISSISRKDLKYSNINLEKTSNKIDSSLIGISTIEPKKVNKCIIDASLSKIGKKKLFNSRKSNSQIPIRNDAKWNSLKITNLKNYQNKRHDFIIAKQNENKTTLFHGIILNFWKIFQFFN